MGRANRQPAWGCKHECRASVCGVVPEERHARLASCRSGEEPGDIWYGQRGRFIQRREGDVLRSGPRQCQPDTFFVRSSGRQQRDRLPVQRSGVAESIGSHLVQPVIDFSFVPSTQRDCSADDGTSGHDDPSDAISLTAPRGDLIGGQPGGVQDLDSSRSRAVADRGPCPIHPMQHRHRSGGVLGRLAG